MRRLGRPCMRPVGCARKKCGPGAVSGAIGKLQLSFSSENHLRTELYKESAVLRIFVL